MNPGQGGSSRDKVPVLPNRIKPSDSIHRLVDESHSRLKIGGVRFRKTPRLLAEFHANHHVNRVILVCREEFRPLSGAKGKRWV